MRFRAAIFDLDGTLLDSLSDIADSMNSVLKRHGFNEHPTANYRIFVGNGMRVLVERALPPNVINQQLLTTCTAQLKDEYATRWNKKTRIYDGIADLLQNLMEKQIALSVLSNKPHDFTTIMVCYYFGDAVFDIVIGAGMFPEKPDPASALYIAKQLKIDSSEILYVGDSSIDMNTAKAAGMFGCGVLWGFRGKEELLKAGADVLVGHPSEIDELLR